MGTQDHVPGSGSTRSSEETPAPAVRTGWRGWVLALLGGVLAGFLTWGIGEYSESVRPYWTPRGPTTAHVYGAPDLGAETIEMRQLSHWKRSALEYGTQGALLGAALGLAGGLTSKSWKRALLAGFLGLLVGGLIAWRASYAALPFVNSFRSETVGDDVLTGFLTHLAGWLPAGLVGGLAFGLGLGGTRRVLGGLLGGLVGAILGTILYEIIGALAFPMANPSMAIGPNPAVRLVAALTLAVAIAAGAVATTREWRATVAPPAT